MSVLIFLATLLFSLLAFASRAHAAPAPPSPPFRVVAYLPDYRAGALDPAAWGNLDGVTDLVFFSLEPTSDGGLDSARLTPAITAKLQDVKRRRALHLWVTVGGWERSAGFAPVATDAAKRSRFVRAVTQFCLSRHFDGADFDWEHPANAPEEAGYVTLLAETHRAFAPHGLRLSVTLAPWQKPDPAGVAAVDAVNLMAYDHPGRHSTLAQAQADVAGFLRQGVPPQKLCLGLPFYGRGIALPDTALAYADILRQYHPAPAVDEVNGLYFNGPETIRQKTRYALAQRLGGVMVWELGQDAPGDKSLLKAIQKTIRQAAVVLQDASLWYNGGEGETIMGSVRLDPKTAEKVRQVAAIKGLTLSEVHRLALAEYCERELVEPKTSRYDDPFYDDIFGAIEGPHDMAARSGEIYREVMDDKYRRHPD